MIEFMLVRRAPSTKKRKMLLYKYTERERERKRDEIRFHFVEEAKAKDLSVQNLIDTARIA